MYKELMISFIIRLTSALNWCFSDLSRNSFIWATFRPSKVTASSSLSKTSASVLEPNKINFEVILIQIKLDLRYTIFLNHEGYFWYRSVNLESNFWNHQFFQKTNERLKKSILRALRIIFSHVSFVFSRKNWEF